MRSPRFIRSFRPAILAMMLGAAALFTLPGCQTYVNIPDQTGDVASANVNGSNVRNLLGEALRGVRSELLRPGRYQILLPAGATPETYNTILKIAGDPYTWANSPDSANVVDQLEIRAIRIRGLDATVDIIRSSDPGNADAPRQLVTVYLKRYLVGGWASQNVRIWRLTVQDALSRSSVATPEAPETPETPETREVAPGSYEASPKTDAAPTTDAAAATSDAPAVPSKSDSKSDSKTDSKSEDQP